MDPAAIRWESLATVVAVFALAIWALGDPEGSGAQSARLEGAMLRLRILPKNKRAFVVDVEHGALLGRGSDCAVVLDDPTVSKHHARFGIEARPSIEDVGSTNGTYVNGRHIAGATALRRGDRIALGTAKIVFLGLAPRGSIHPKG